MILLKFGDVANCLCDMRVTIIVYNATIQRSQQFFLEFRHGFVRHARQLEFIQAYRLKKQIGMFLTNASISGYNNRGISHGKMRPER